ncbi:hypothetical protein CLAFUW4_06028 [Fulvia fulva]|uniref:Uncharacterized protein n=1 Tax=Passalora fulva TaxID=5499 RepID=A0A9Q8P8U5_PASFU|nr:uncharacterized protein CLAFUR5_06172 [Fulvia fulva]KAK4624318.1 hypothetical protein CLAFUR4_06033 [Fulvia fulva]KAK4625540.1 hypothetical protein CLAFUR0_06036 [Fulvia fulva]UJO17372.1 hypothetical protein CLAFUR5_06172 [Fulvia fulva]WPV15066.1 hypothetical protein CLAFUW4_06028 [Fulvia fulva]WPV29802.1 hypothetical protein CLAFUW7_06026 [Fulvia fulva]
MSLMGREWLLMQETYSLPQRSKSPASERLHRETYMGATKGQKGNETLIPVFFSRNKHVTAFPPRLPKTSRREARKQVVIRAH